MAHGDRAERSGHPGREYWSRRLRGAWPWGKMGKQVTHRRERAKTRRDEHRALHQEQLGEDFARVLYDNLWDLYAR